MNKQTFITLRSQTHAIKARKLLAAVGIQARVVKATGEAAELGCGYGVSVNDTDTKRAAEYLRNKNIPPLRLFKAN